MELHEGMRVRVLETASVVLARGKQGGLLYALDDGGAKWRVCLENGACVDVRAEDVRVVENDPSAYSRTLFD